MSAHVLALALASALLAGVFSASAAFGFLGRMARMQRREAAYGREVARAGRVSSGDMQQRVLRYAESLTRRIYAGAAVSIAPSVRAGRSSSTRAGKWYAGRSRAAGCAKTISAAGFCEARMRLALAGGLAGALLGSVLSNEMGVVLGAAGALVLHSMPRRAVGAACKARTVEAQRHLSEMLEVVALGLRSGLTFDRSFALYGSHFDNGFARSCAKAHRSWALGLVTREEALRDLAASYDCEQLHRVVESVVRSLRFGSALTATLEEAAAQSRANYRTALEERVAKAPVKMMLPTGTLILPAMLLLVMGPILLELAGGFS